MKQISVKEVDGEIMVGLQGFPSMSSNILPSTTFWLSPDDADKLAFQLNSQLQEMDVVNK